MKLNSLRNGISMGALRHGMQMLIYDGVCTQMMGVLTGGAILVAYALLLGASNVTIGILAAIAPLSQIFQIPAIYLIHRQTVRKRLVILYSGIGRIFLFLAAFVPWLVPVRWQLLVFITCLCIYFGTGAVSGCAWNSWMRDFIPDRVMGGYFAQRLSVATALGAVLSVLAGYAVFYYEPRLSAATMIYSILFALGAGAGLVGLIFLGRTPEPSMAKPPALHLVKVLAEPFQNKNYRQLLIFLGWWNFSINLAAPFFTVYLIKRIGLNMVWIMGLAVFSQIFNIIFFRIWGKLSDRFTNKSVLAISGSLFILSIVLWPFTTISGPYALTFPLLFLIHILAGISTAGVALCSGNIAMKIAPYGRSTTFLAVNALISGIAATLAPVLAGFSADWFEERQLRFIISWESLSHAIDLPAVSIKGLDFLFMISFFLGLYSLHRLLAVSERGEVKKEVVLGALGVEMRRVMKSVSNVAGLRRLSYFPYQLLLKRRQEKRAQRESKISTTRSDRQIDTFPEN